MDIERIKRKNPAAAEMLRRIGRNVRVATREFQSGDDPEVALALAEIMTRYAVGAIAAAHGLYIGAEASSAMATQVVEHLDAQLRITIETGEPTPLFPES